MLSLSDAAEIAARLERIQKLTDQLARAPADLIERQDLAARIYREIEAARNALRPTK